MTRKIGTSWLLPCAVVPRFWSPRISATSRQMRSTPDVARPYHQWGKPDPCYRALLAAERAAPAEVRYRPSTALPRTSSAPTAVSPFLGCPPLPGASEYQPTSAAPHKFLTGPGPGLPVTAGTRRGG